MSIIGTIAVNVVSRHAPFVRGMDQSRRSVGRMSTSVAAADRTMRIFGRTMAAGFAIFTTGRIASAIKRSADELGNLADTSDKLGISTERLAGLRLGGKLSGLEARTVDKSLERMIRRIADVATTGKGEALPVLKQLGLEANKLAAMTPDQMLGRVADSMVKVSTQTERVRLAYRLFGRDGVALNVMLKNGAAGLEDFQRQAEQLGIVLTRGEIKRVEELGDAMDKLSRAWGGLKDRLIIDIAPAAITGIENLLEAQRGFALLKKHEREQGTVGTGAAGFFSRLFAGETGLQKAITEGMVRGQIKAGFETGTAAPDLKVLGPRGVGSVMAREPGFDPAAIEKQRGQVFAMEHNQARQAALPYLINQGREAGKRWVDAFSKVVSGHGEGEDKIKGLGERIRDTLSVGRDALVENQRSFLLNELSGRGGASRQRTRSLLAEIRKGQAAGEGGVQFASNEALQRGSSAAYAASRQSDRINRVMSEQLVQQKATAEGVRELVAQGRKAVEDVFGGGV